MLVTRREDRLVLVTQPEHGALAGRLAVHWGNAGFARPAARQALLIAAAHHDDGWLELDRGPVHHARARRPAAFVELPLSESVGPYTRNIESLYERDLRAGALVGMHLSGFYTGRWGLSRGAATDDPQAREVVATQEARWMPALREAWGQRGPRSAFDADTWYAYEVLQALDLISLALGLLDLQQPCGGRDVLDMARSLRSIDQPAGDRMITGVPQAPGAPRLDLRLTVAAPGRVVLDPYPFSEPKFEVSLAARSLEDRRYESARQSAEAYHRAPVEQVVALIARSR